MAIELSPFIITLKLAILSTGILFVVSLPLAYWLAFSKVRFKYVLESVVTLPLILPPSVLGFYLLVAFSPDNFFGRFLENFFDLRLVFTFPGLVIASVIYSLPFMVQPFQTGFKMIPASLTEMSFTLGKDRWTTLRKVQLPNMRAALITGLILAFAHTVGEFGVVLMIGGNIAGETRVVAIALYDEVQAMKYETAGIYALVLLVFSMFTLLTVYLINHRLDKTRSV